MGMKRDKKDEEDGKHYMLPLELQFYVKTIMYCCSLVIMFT